MHRFWSFACLAAAGTLACGSAMAAQSHRLSTKQPATAPATVVFKGAQVAIDPATGRLREPTDAERQALTRAMLQKQASDAVMPRAAGERPRNQAEALATLRKNAHGRVGMSMQVPENQFDYLTAERTADGRLSIHHQGDAQASAAPVEVTQ